MFRYRGTTIPNWACKMWGIDDEFSSCTSRKNPSSIVKVKFKEKTYGGWITIAKEGRSKPAYRLWYPEQLSYDLKDAFLMSFVRDIEDRLRRPRKVESSIEDEIPFWEFLDIEYERESKTFYFEAYYTQKPAFSELFKHFVESPILHKIDDELNRKPPFRIYKNKWRRREELEFELGAHNVLYFLIDTKRKLLYVGEAAHLIDRLRQDHPSIREWNYFRYSILPNEMAPHRQTLERMIITDFALILESHEMGSMKISDYRLANDRVDTR